MQMPSRGISHTYETDLPQWLGVMRLEWSRPRISDAIASWSGKWSCRCNVEQADESNSFLPLNTFHLSPTPYVALLCDTTSPLTRVKWLHIFDNPAFTEKDQITLRDERLVEFYSLRSACLRGLLSTCVE